MKLKKYNYLLAFFLMLTIKINTVLATVVTTDREVNAGDCNALLGDPTNEQHIAYWIKEILKFPQYIVPFIVIGLGVLDFAKAVLASKEDEMRKAQATFIKRVLIGVAVFLVPIMVDILMQFADIILGGGTIICR